MKIAVDFRAVSRMGDTVMLGLNVKRLGTRSMILTVRCLDDGSSEVRVEMEQVLVTASLDTHRAVGVPAALHAAVAESMAAHGRSVPQGTEIGHS